MMNVYKILILIFSLFVLTASIGSISAHDNATGISEEISNDSCRDYDLTSSIDDDNETITSSQTGNTFFVEPDGENPNQMVKPTIQPVIDIANPGDTIVLNGDFPHCQFVINKTLNIVAYNATLGPCPNYQSEGSGSYGVFYITEGGSGSVISGVTFKNNARAVTPFTFLIRGASNITIKDCTVSYPESSNYKFQGITIEDSTNINLSNLIINNTINGIRIINSSIVNIDKSNLLNSQNQAISVVGISRDIRIANNSIIGNRKFGINLASVDNVRILNNLIKDNGVDNYDSGSGIYVNCNITSMTVKGNFFLRNALHAILYDYRTRNLNNEEGADKLTIVDNNYFEGHDSMILHHRIYVERSYGPLKYDAENDVYGDVGEGNYVEGKSYVYMQHALISNDVPCGFTYYTPEIPWTLESSGNDGKYDFRLKLSNIIQIRNGIYKVSIVDSNGKVAEDFNSFYITFFLNDYSTVEPQADDIYKRALVQNGVATADFSKDYLSFNSSGNVITAVLPGLSRYVAGNMNVKLKILDSDIPINPKTTIIASKLTTYPLYDSYFSAKLVNSKGVAVSNQKLVFKINGNEYTAKTNGNGIAKVKVSLTSKKTYPVTVVYHGTDGYSDSKTTSSIIVKKGKAVIKAHNIKIKKNKKKIYKFKLTNDVGKAIKNQKVTIRFNNKAHVVKTNKYGVAKISIKLKKVKKYKIVIKFSGNANFKAVSKKAILTVTK